MSFAKLPHTPSIPVEPFTINVPQGDIDHLRDLLKLTRVPKATFENTNADKEDFGISREWMQRAKDEWTIFDWRAQEKRINDVPQFIAQVKNSEGQSFNIHFAALFSTRPDAVPIVFSHGWPGCFLEFIPMIEHLRSTHDPATFPYHIIVPSLPGFAFSSPPPLDREFTKAEVAYLFDGLVRGLGFENYAVQGGDIGASISLLLAKNHDACKAIHLNFKFIRQPPKGTPEGDAAAAAPPPDMLQIMGMIQKFGYALEQGTRPSTIGLVVGSNPFSLLSWIGEKYAAWSDETSSLNTILTFASLYWFTDTYPSSIYTYRYNWGTRALESGGREKEEEYMAKPTGYSMFPKEIMPTPPSWVGSMTNLVWHNTHTSGGHFAALEKPVELWSDVDAFMKVAWGQEPKPKSA